MSYKNICASLLCIALLITSQVDAQETTKTSQENTATSNTEHTTKMPHFDTEFAGVPFIISTDTLGTAVGAAGIIKHAGQPQASIFGLGLYSKNDSNIGFLSFQNYALPGLKSWLFSTEYYRGYLSNGIYYLPVPKVRGERRATNEIIAEGTETSLRVNARYVLPWGLGANGAARSLIPERGDMAFNPLTSGVTSINVTPFQQQRDITGYDYLPNTSQGLELKFDWDNRDSVGDTESGSQTRFTVRRDFGNDERNSWTTWELEQSAFVPFDENMFFKEQVLAFNYYLADTPTWDSGTGVAGKHRPPAFAGIKLGGFNRLRGYSTAQFYSRSAVSYSAEYRVKPHWQPLQNLPFYSFPWWQWSAFVETGQVADSFDIDELHDDLKWTAGLGLRFNVEGVLVRIDFAKSENGGQTWFMVNQPF
ncbi:MAG: BamA/TamA family outer membrane protein [Moritella sp.]|uniref:BamA/TamA family outer membrane protein n=1 Tax=Moritella sp. TaxID=78556 RepID=UPI0029A27230|nr:BamA/TamA family outer membrane protein [Moritella sp.]MDX2319020.1 BamA/TamA family outer membrane protein [Moritella sp.]